MVKKNLKWQCHNIYSINNEPTLVYFRGKVESKVRFEIDNTLQNMEIMHNLPIT